MEDHCPIRQDTPNEGGNQSPVTSDSSGICETQVSGGESCGLRGQGCPDPWPERGGLLTDEELNATGHRSISVTYLTELHQIAIHKFNHSDSDFSLGFWNGYGCAIKAVLEKLEDFS
ncbi:MAG: hypothetical protein FJ211_09170 [Ignavibacteria bacterium]|nr:hypothetical protein [Ignavibacteria bacterium]